MARYYGDWANQAVRKLNNVADYVKQSMPTTMFPTPCAAGFFATNLGDTCVTCPIGSSSFCFTDITIKRFLAHHPVVHPL
jgi:hypothetical protein